MEYKKASEIAREYFFDKHCKSEATVKFVLHRLHKKLNFPHAILKKSKIYNVEQINRVLLKNNKPILKLRENEKQVEIFKKYL